MKRLVLLSLVAFLSTAVSGVDQAQSEKMPWPKIRQTIEKDPVVEAKIDALIDRMSLEQKVGQMIQAEIKSISPDDAAKYHIGSILNGGGSWPTDKADGPLAGWLSLANMFYGASMDTGEGRFAIPVLWGTDAVHGHNNVVGATIFPHNIGLGAANNPDLMRDIGAVTAREVAITGIDWAFSPTIAVAKDGRWGRTYESYSENTSIVENLSREYILGLQGHPALGNFLNEEKIIATAKHFVADGGTTLGDDQGDTALSEQQLYDIHGRPYVQAIGAGVQTVMASFSSWNGEKMHGHKYLLTDVLKGRMGFDGLVVSDWNAHEQLPGCSTTKCAAIINAGVDLLMVPEKWRDFQTNTIRQVKDGEISLERIEDAVRRILRVKFRAGMFEDGKPSEHVLAGRATLLGAPEHREIARAAVRQSLVLLKNEGILPLSPKATLLVTGSGADDPAVQAGGWTVSWQGRDNKKSDYKNFTTILSGITEATKTAGGAVITSLDEAEDKPDAAIIVFGETPYAEFEGDLATPDFDVATNEDVKLLMSLKEQDIPVVAVFLSGRPRGLDSVIDASDAFVAAWLPGSEGGNGIADLLVADKKGHVRHDFKGRLSFAWPRTWGDRIQTDAGSDADPLYPLGYGLSYESMK